MNKLRYRLAVQVNGVHSFTIQGNAPSARKLIEQFQTWYKFMEPELAYQEIEYLPMRADTRDAKTELSVTRIA